MYRFPESYWFKANIDLDTVNKHLLIYASSQLEEKCPWLYRQLWSLESPNSFYLSAAKDFVTNIWLVKPNGLKS